MEGIGLRTEHDYMIRVARGEEQAFAHLYRKYADIVHRFILPFVSFHTAEAEEMVQEVFLKIWIKRSYLEQVNNFQSYVFQVAKNHTIDRIRAKKPIAMDIEACQEILPANQMSSYHELLLKEYYSSAQTVIDRLSPQRKRIFEMRNKEGLNLDEIACRLNISKSGVKKQLYEATHFVKACLQKEQDLILAFLLFSLVG